MWANLPSTITGLIAFVLLTAVGQTWGQNDTTPEPTPNPYPEVIGKLAESISESAKASQKRLDESFQRMSQKPKDLLNGGEGAAGLAAMLASKTGANSISFQRLQGFDGLDEFEPSGWSLSVGEKASTPHPSDEKEQAAVWPSGVGNALMNGCSGKDYKPGDPCYGFARLAPICPKVIDAAAFIGVGFDGRGYYSADSRKMSIIQRVCNKKHIFMNAYVPDNMNAFGLWDYSIETQSFQDAKSYIRYLQEKAATSETESMFQMEAESMQQSFSAGGDLGVIGAIAGAALGAYAGAGAQGAQMGGKVGKALGESIGFNVGFGSGSSSNEKEGSYEKSERTSQSASRGSTKATNMIAVLEADMKLYEIALDEVKYSDMSTYFLNDFMKLPQSYGEIGADASIQEFILKWGTHYIKSAKFGGELRIMKTSKVESKLTQDEFSETTQDEFAGMMGTLKNSFEQKEAGFSYFGLGAKFSSKSQEAKLKNEKSSGGEFKSVSEGSKNNERSKFIKTTVRVMGGDPTIGAAITDFYTPKFRETFVSWLKSIDDFIRPYEFTLGKVSSLLGSSKDLLFPSGDAYTGGCFGEDVLKDDNGRLYFVRTVAVKDASNDTIEEKVRNYCDYKSSEDMLEAISKKKLTLERGESIYMTEGPSPTSYFDVEGGEPGCELDALRFLSGTDETLQTWPSLDSLRKREFKVIFDMRQNLPYIDKNAEFYVKYYGGRWFTRKSETTYNTANSCGSFAEKRVLCIGGIPVVYHEEDGTFGLDIDTYLKFKVNVPLWLREPLGRFEVLDGNIDEAENQIGKVGLVPCNLKWSNSHKVMVSKGNGDQTPPCLYFRAATEGSIHIIFAGLPKNYKTWYSVRISSAGVSFFQSMKLQKMDNKIEKGILGSKNIFEAYFICLKRVDDKLVIEYGKSSPDAELGLIYSSHMFTENLPFDRFFYSIGSGEKRVSVTDLRLVREAKPRKCLEKGAVQVNGVCTIHCHEQCDGCHHANSARSCTRCKRVKILLSRSSFLCATECPEGSSARTDKTCACDPGYHMSDTGGQMQCKRCPAGTKSNGLYCQDCPANTKSRVGSENCEDCPKGYFSGRRSKKCEKEDTGECNGVKNVAEGGKASASTVSSKTNFRSPESVFNDIKTSCDADWSRDKDVTCQVLKDYNYCKEDGDHYGSAWSNDWGKFSDYTDSNGRTALVCPQCGCIEGWLSERNLPQWIQYTMKEPVVVCKFEFVPVESLDKSGGMKDCPTSYRFQGSKDGKYFEDLFLAENQPECQPDTSQKKTFKNRTAYKIYRLQVDDVPGDKHGKYAALGKLYLYGQGT